MEFPATQLNNGHKLSRSANILSLPSGLLAKHKPGQAAENIRITSEQEASSIQRLWLCIYLPRLAVDALACDDKKPLAVTEERSGRILIYACNRKAQNHGITPGLPLASALALCQTLGIFSREPFAEQRRLNRLGVLAFDFSNTISLYTVNSVVLEVKGSLRLFSGINKLLKRLNQRLKKFAGEAIVSIAPTARAALWLAQYSGNRFIAKAEELASALRDLPVSVLTSDKRCLIRLRRSGIATVADILRLPRDGITRRFDACLIEQLDFALAKQPEPLNLFYPFQPFSASVELYWPTHKLERLIPACSILLKQLEGFLVGRQAATQHIQCVLSHGNCPATVIDIGSNFYIQRAERFIPLCKEHLEQTQLPAEVTEVTVHSNQIDVFFPEQFDLFDTSSADENRWQQLVERFRARLGEEALQSLSLHSDHRPEKAGTASAFPGVMGKTSKMPRPLWLLSRPEPLKASSQRLYWHGLLSLSSEVECIEQGWWDGTDVRRDYRIARNPDGSRLWLFRDRRSKRWFVHGLFG